MEKISRFRLQKGQGKPTINLNLGKDRRDFLVEEAEKRNRSASFIMQKIVDQFRSGNLNLDFLNQYSPKKI